jgi:hypothetical protein
MDEPCIGGSKERFGRKKRGVELSWEIRGRTNEEWVFLGY